MDTTHHLSLAWRVTLAYAVFAALWILISDFLLNTFVNVQAREIVATYKGITFVVVTACLLYTLLTREARKLYRTEEENRRRADQFTALYATSLDITLIHNLPRLLNALVERACKLLNASSGEIYLCDAEKQEVVGTAGYNLPRPAKGLVLKYGEGATGKVAATGQPLIIDDDTAREGRSEKFSDDPLNPTLLVPILWRDQVIGVINAQERGVPRQFTQADLELLTLFAAQAAVAIENSRLHEKIEDGHQHLLSLTRKLVEVQENERRDLAREMHDQVGQNLTALNLNLNIIMSQLTADSMLKVKERLEDSVDLVSETVKRVRDVMSNLRPAVLDDYGLMAALHWYSEQFSKRTGLTTMMCGVHTLRRLPPQVETAFFRITQEALTNVVKHAQAKLVTISLDGDPNVARLTIADDGVGFTFDRSQFSKERRGLGLVGMKERANAVNARLWIESAPAQGTKVVVEASR